ncbi:hypothetical protein V8B97DRAFT_1414511 [Scleroderma yunnanense]
MEELYLRKQDTRQAMIAQMKTSHEQFDNLILANTSLLDQLVDLRTQVMETVEDAGIDPIAQSIVQFIIC